MRLFIEESIMHTVMKTIFFIFLSLSFLNSADLKPNEWTVQFETEATDEGKALTVDKDGFIYVTGNVISTKYIGTDEPLFISKYRPDGSLVWTKESFTINSLSDFDISLLDKDLYSDVFGAQEVPTSIITDKDGNMYVAGSTHEGLYKYDVNSVYWDKSAFVIKLSSDGEILWKTLLGAELFERVRTMAIDSHNNIYVAGVIQVSYEKYKSYGDKNMFLSKLDNNGTLVWTQELGAEETDYAESIAIDSDENILLVGLSSPVSGRPYIKYSPILYKFNPNGLKIFEKEIEKTTSSLIINDMTIKKQYVYLSGYSNFHADSYSIDNYYLAKYDTNGTKIWIRDYGALENGGLVDNRWLGDNRAKAITVDSNGYIYATGSAGRSMDGHVYLDYLSTYWIGDVVVNKFSSDGLKIWTKQFGTNRYDTANDIVYDNNGSLYITGGTYGSLDANSSSNSGDAFFSKISINQEEINATGTISYVRTDGNTLNWHLISPPIAAEISVEELKIDKIYSWANGVFGTPTVLEPGHGYWVLPKNNIELSFTKNRIFDREGLFRKLANVKSNSWSLMGTPYDITFSELKENIGISEIYTFNAKTFEFEQNENILAGQGFWVR